MEKDLDEYLEEIKTRISIEEFLEKYRGHFVEGQQRDLYETLRNDTGNIDHVLKFARQLALIGKHDLVELLCGIALSKVQKYPLVYQILSQVHHDIANQEYHDGLFEKAKKSYKFSREISERGLEYIDELSGPLLNMYIGCTDNIEDNKGLFEKLNMLFRSYSSKHDQKLSDAEILKRIHEREAI